MSPFALIWRIVLLELGFAAGAPISTSGLGPHPHPARDFISAMAMADSDLASDAGIVAPGGAPIRLTHGSRSPRAFVLLHGFSNSPRQFEALAKDFFSAGDNVYVPRLPGHAQTGEDIAATADVSAEQLRTFTDRVIDIAHGLGDTVIVVGLSAGGTLAAWAAQHRPDVSRAVIIAPALEVARIPGLLAEPAMNLSLRLPNITRHEPPNTSRPDRELGFTTHGLGEIFRLGVATRRHAERDALAAPEAFVLLNAHDKTVRAAPILALARRWKRATAYELPDSLAQHHDIVDPAEPGIDTAVTYPVIRALARGQAPPVWVRTLLAPRG